MKVIKGQELMSLREVEYNLRKTQDLYIEIRDQYLEECREVEKEPDHDLLGIPYKGLRPRSVREAILSVVSMEEPTSIQEIIDKVTGMDSYHTNAIRNEVTKLSKNKVLRRVATGKYIKEVDESEAAIGTQKGEVVVLGGKK